MSSRSLIIAVAQSLCRPGDLAGNIERMRPLVADAARANARLILFAEAGVTGYTPTCPTLTVGDAHCCELQTLAKQSGLVIVAGFMERNGAQIHISQGAFFPDGQLVVQRKARPGPPESTIPNWRPGPDERTVFTVDGVRCAIAICADTGIPDYRNTLARQGVELLLLPTAGCGPRSWGLSEATLDDPQQLDAYVQKAATVVFSGDAIRDSRRQRMALATCNQMADTGVDYFHPGHSMIVDSTGELVALIPGCFIFEHLRARVAWGVIHPQKPQVVLP